MLHLRPSNPIILDINVLARTQSLGHDVVWKKAKRRGHPGKCKEAGNYPTLSATLLLRCHRHGYGQKAQKFPVLQHLHIFVYYLVRVIIRIYIYKIYKYLPFITDMDFLIMCIMIIPLLFYGVTLLFMSTINTETSLVDLLFVCNVYVSNRNLERVIMVFPGLSLVF